MSLFDSWDVVDLQIQRRSTSLNKVRIYKSSGGEKRGEYWRMFISRNLIDEAGADRFVLRTKGGTYALVPAENGPLYYRDGRVGGISSKALEEITEKIMQRECNASVIDGAIVFPIGDNFIIG